MLRRFASAASSANKVLVINSGSSSLKFKLFDQSQNWSVAASGLVERIGETSGSVLNVTTGDGPKQSTTETIPDHNVAIEKVISVLTSRFSASLSQEVAAVGHRVVHGGDSFSKATVVTPEVEAAIQRVTPLAPLHNPANLAGITASRVTFPCPQVRERQNEGNGDERARGEDLTRVVRWVWASFMAMVVWVIRLGLRFNLTRVVRLPDPR